MKNISIEARTALQKSVATFDARTVDSVASRSDLYAARQWDVSAARDALRGDFGAFDRLPQRRRDALLSGNGPI